MALAIRRQETINEKARATVLEVVAFLVKLGDTAIGRAYAVNLFANVLCVPPWKSVRGFLRICAPRDQYGNLPFILCIG